MTEKRLKCRSCGYPMRVVTETDDGYECYCAECKMDRYIEKYSFKQLVRDMARGKVISDEDLIDLYQRQDEKIRQLEFGLKECREHKLFSRRELEKENKQLKRKIERIDFILDDLNGAEYISRDDGIKALNKIDKVIGKR